jgi:hypothetical protein
LLGMGGAVTRAVCNSPRPQFGLINARQERLAQEEEEVQPPAPFEPPVPQARQLSQ